MANRNHFNKDGSKSGMVGKPYVVDSGRLFNLPVYQTTPKKPEREMITKIFIWLWWGVGLPCWLSSIFTNILGWIHLGDVKEFITLMLSVILGISQVVVMWAEKWDKIVARVKRIVGKKRKRRINP